MAFQSNVFRGGQWVTQTVDLQAILKANAATRTPRQRTLKPAECGILTKTVVESPVSHWIVPVRLRSPHHNDVAFVSVSCCGLLPHFACPVLLSIAGPPARVQGPGYHVCRRLPRSRLLLEPERINPPSLSSPTAVFILPP